MCGISGIINRDNTSVNRQLIQTVNDLIVHRGPDGEGFFYGDNFAFGHRRLAILDLSADGVQPMGYLGKYTITYNGEIFNYLEIKEQLIDAGYGFRSSTDTEVILAAYDKWGKNCVDRFNGMWAFAIYDSTQKVIFCSRDRFGIKPFYYSEIGNQFIFGSEIKQILELKPGVSANKSILLDFVVFGFSEHTCETFFDGIYCLAAAHNMTYDLVSHETTVEKYYEIQFNDDLEKLSEDDAVEYYGALLEDSVKLRLRSDVKVGTCLSGGLDSSSIATLASANYAMGKKKFTAVTASSIDPLNDETAYARIVVEKSDLDWHTVCPDLDDFIKSLDGLVYAQEEPIASPSLFMQFSVFNKAKTIGCKVFLDGQGGDETLLGYERYYPAYLLSLPWRDKFAEFQKSATNSKLSKVQLLKFIIYFCSSSLRWNRQLRRCRFLDECWLGFLSRKTVGQLARSYRSIRNLQQLEITSTQLPHLLRFADKNSMANSIEVRLPFIDYRVLEAALSINNKFKIKQGWTKYLLRKSMAKKLPDSIVWRKNKFGFEAPSDMWLQKHNAYIKETLNDSIILQQLGYRMQAVDDDLQWRLFFIALWADKFNVSLNANNFAPCHE